MGKLREGRDVKILLRGEESEGRAAPLEDAVPPAWEGPPLHHHGWDEAFYVLAGELTFQVADQVVTKRAGEVAFAHSGVHHTFANLSDAPAAYLVVCTSGLIRALLRRRPPGGSRRPPEEVCRRSVPRIAVWAATSCQ